MTASVKMAGSTATSLEAALARQARELFVAGTCQTLEAAAKTVGEKLSDMLNESATARDSQDRRDTWTAYQKGQAGWVRAVATGLKKSMLPPSQPSRSSSNAMSFELMGNEVVENKILTSRLSLRIQDKASWELNDLTLRIRMLDNVTDLDRHDVFRPDTCANVVVEAWLESGLSRDAWIGVQEIVNKAFSERMVGVYNSVNALLVSNGVMPEIDLRDLVRRAPSTAMAGLEKSSAQTSYGSICSSAGS